VVPAPSELVACCEYCPGLWFPQILGSLPVSEPVLHHQYIAGPEWLESF
jgi:hypothetical protein